MPSDSQTSFVGKVYSQTCHVSKNKYLSAIKTTIGNKTQQIQQSAAVEDPRQLWNVNSSSTHVPVICHQSREEQGEGMVHAE